MSVIVKGDSPFDAFIVSGIKGCHTEHIKFYNISFNCKTIEDADGRVFTRREERKTGKWIKSNNSCTIRCNQCGQEMTSLCDIQLPNYCLNCGSQMMRGEEE